MTAPEPIFLYCQDPTCSEYGLAKGAPPAYADELVVCGECAQPVTADAPGSET